MTEEQRCGTVVLYGRPSVGKSTLLNQILGERLSISSPKPQTTRRRILGIKTMGAVQTVYLDTPGLYFGPRRTERKLNRIADGALDEATLVLMVAEAGRWDNADEQVLKHLSADTEGKIVLVLNKTDRLKDRRELLPQLQMLDTLGVFRELVPVSARCGENLQALEECIASYMPPQKHFFAADVCTTEGQAALIGDLVHEKCFQLLDRELPYLAVPRVENIEQRERLLYVSALIYVARERHKRILVGRGGAMIRRIGTAVRKDLQRSSKGPVYLDLRVKVGMPAGS